MKIKLTRDLLIGKVDHTPGDVVDVDPAIARKYIEKGDATAVEEFPPDVQPVAGRRRVVPPPELTGEVLPVAPKPGETVVKEGAVDRVVTAVAEPNEATVEVPAELQGVKNPRVPDAVVPNAKDGEAAAKDQPKAPAPKKG